MFRQIRETTLLWKPTKGFGWFSFTSWTCSNSMYELKRVKAKLKGIIKKKDQTIKNGAEKVGNFFKKRWAKFSASQQNRQQEEATGYGAYKTNDEIIKERNPVWPTKL